MGAFQIFPIFGIKMLDGVISFIEGDGAGSELLWTSGESEYGVGEDVIESLLNIESDHLS